MSPIILFSLFSLPIILSQDITFQDDNDSFVIDVGNAPPAFGQSVSGHQGINPETDVAGSVTNLGLALHRVGRSERNDWEVYSPTSIASALYMVLLGANGKTFSELSTLLGLPFSVNFIKPHEDFGSILRHLQFTGNNKNIIKIANGLFVQNEYQIREDYKENSVLVYESELMNLDFETNGSYAKQVVNDWVSSQTLGKIVEILAENPPPETKIIIVNSLYFKGEWANPFPTSLTKLQPFYPDGKSQPSNIKFSMMATQGTYRYYHDHELNCEVVGIPYIGESIVFYVVIPQNSNKKTLKTLEDHLSQSNLNNLFDNANLTYDVIVAIPKMKLTAYYLLNNQLQDLGLRSLFNPTEADLSLLATPKSSHSLTSTPPQHKDQFTFPKGRKSERKKRQIKEESQKLVSNTQGRNDNALNSERLLRSADNPGLYVNQVLHKVVIDVNEKGTEAAATTLVSMTKTVSYIVKADVPFLFFIRHEPTKMLLFWGSVKTPPV